METRVELTTRTKTETFVAGRDRLRLSGRLDWTPVELIREGQMVAMLGRITAVRLYVTT